VFRCEKSGILRKQHSEKQQIHRVKGSGDHTRDFRRIALSPTSVRKRLD
jgi:hypothetical protein